MQQQILWKNIETDPQFKSKALGYNRPCPICGGLASRSILQLNDFQFYMDAKNVPKRFDINQSVCTECFTVYLNPCYSEYGFHILFSEAGQSYGSLAEHTKEQISWLKERGLIEAKTKLLDVGCFDGGFLAQLPSGVEKVGVDIDEPAIERGRNKYAKDDIKFYLGDFETFDYSEAPPDTITMYHVLEHLPNPVRVLQKLRRISKKKTDLVIEVPVIDNGNTNDIHGFFTIQHTTHFSRTSLKNCLAASGWSVVSDYQTKDYNGYRVIARPNEEDAFVPECRSGDLGDIYNSLISWHSSILEVEKKIQLLEKNKKLVIWGAGAHTEYLYQLTSLFHSKKYDQFILIDSDDLKHGQKWRGINVYKPSILTKCNWIDTQLLISSYGSQDVLLEIALQSGVPEKNIIILYDHIRRY